MQNTLEKAVAEVDEDLSSEWMALTARVRNLMAGIDAKAVGTSLSNEIDELGAEISKLCNHVDRLHTDVGNLLARLDAPGSGDPLEREETPEIQEEALQIQREIHEGPPNVKDVVKALFMWRDDPAERVREKH